MKTVLDLNIKLLEHDIIFYLEFSGVEGGLFSWKKPCTQKIHPVIFVTAAHYTKCLVDNWCDILI